MLWTLPTQHVQLASSDLFVLWTCIGATNTLCESSIVALQLEEEAAYYYAMESEKLHMEDNWQL